MFGSSLCVYHPISEIPVLVVMLMVLVLPQAISGPGCFPTNVKGVFDVGNMVCLYMYFHICIFTFFPQTLQVNVLGLLPFFPT